MKNMEEKKFIKVSLRTVVCLIIIVVLIIALGTIYYLKVVKKNELENKKNNNGNSISDNEWLFTFKKEEYKNEYIYFELIDVINGVDKHYQLVKRDKSSSTINKIIIPDTTSLEYQLYNGKIYYYNEKTNKIAYYDIDNDEYGTFNFIYQKGDKNWEVYNNYLYFLSSDGKIVKRYDMNTEKFIDFFSFNNNEIDVFDGLICFYQNKYCFILDDHELYTLDLEGNCIKRYSIASTEELYGFISIKDDNLHIYRKTIDGEWSIVMPDFENPIIININKLIK